MNHIKFKSITLIIALRPKCVCGAPSFSIMILSSSKLNRPLPLTLYLQKIRICLLLNSQNARLRPAMLAIVVSVRQGNFRKIILSRFHQRFSIQLTGQYCSRLRWWHLTAKTGECYVIKRFLLENPGFLPGFRIFPDFFSS